MDRIGCTLGAMAAPPFGIVLGIIAGVVLWFALGDAGLPSWARVLISLMAVTAIPGLWFVVMPAWFMLPQVAKVQTPAGHDEWFARQMQVWEEHGETLRGLVAAPIQSVLAFGLTRESATMRITVLALDISERGGCIWLQYASLDTNQPIDEPPDDLAVRLEDDLGTEYAVSTQCLDTATGGGRCSLYVVPAPPASAQRLRLTVDRFYLFGHDDAIEGPWTFDLALAPERLRRNRS